MVYTCGVPARSETKATRLPSGLQEAEMSMPRDSVMRRAPAPSAWARYTSVLSFRADEKRSRVPSGDQAAQVAKWPESTSARIFCGATSTTKRFAPVPSRKLEKAMLFPPPAHDGSRLMDAPV